MPSLLAEQQQQPDAGRNSAIETSARATDANMVAVSCIIMNETSAIMRERTGYYH